SGRHCPGFYGQSISGYEIHMGRTTGENPGLKITRRGGSEAAVLDGSDSHDGRIWGSYVHGLFANDRFRQAWLDSLERQAGASRPASGGEEVTAFTDDSADWT